MKISLCGSKAEADALNIYLKLVRATDKITSETHRHLAAFGLTSSQFAVLEAIFHLGPLSQREIAHKILKSHGNITMVINNLLKRNLVARQRDDFDRRLYSVALTDQGGALVRTIFPRHTEKIVHCLNSLTPAERHELGRLCRKLGLNQ